MASNNMTHKKNRYNKAVRRRARVASVKKRLTSAARWLGIMALVAGVSGALVLAYFAMIRSPYFKIKGIEVEGCRRVDQTDLVRRMGISGETNILELNLQKINREIEGIPWVERASVRRRLPDRLAVHIWEHEPRALVSLDHLYYLSRTGKPFKRIEAGDDLNFPVITGLSREALFDNPLRAREVIDCVLWVLNYIEQNRVPFDLSQISEIQVSEGIGVSLLVSQGNLKIILGLSSLAEKFRRLNVVRDDLEKKGRWKRVKCIDLDFGDRVIVS
jgi:cell division protein FtsQ